MVESPRLSRILVGQLREGRPATDLLKGPIRANVLVPERGALRNGTEFKGLLEQLYRTALPLAPVLQRFTGRLPAPVLFEGHGLGIDPGGIVEQPGILGS